jgi:hypothetical protein
MVSIRHFRQTKTQNVHEFLIGRKFKMKKNLKAGAWECYSTVETGAGRGLRFQHAGQERRRAARAPRRHRADQRCPECAERLGLRLRSGALGRRRQNPLASGHRE